VTSEQKSRVLVCDGEGIAVAAVTGLELSLEVGGPEIIGSFGRGCNDSRVLMRTTPTPPHHQPTARKEICGRAGRRPFRHAGVPSGQNTQKLSCSPKRVLPTEIAYELRELAVNAIRTMVRGSAPILEPTSPLLFVPREPLVADATTDAISSTQLRHRKAIAKCVANKSNPLFHGCSLQPRHRPSSQDKA
jgi:hypothetical protein